MNAEACILGDTIGVPYGKYKITYLNPWTLSQEALEP